MSSVRPLLEDIASNIWWSWNPRALKIFETINPEVFRGNANNPLAVLATLPEDCTLSPELVEELNAVHLDFKSYMNEKGEMSSKPEVAYFCMEYGLHESLRLYSGGLGVLAGDHTKAASDLDLPFTAIGLLLRDGYGEQFVSPDGIQSESYPSMNIETAPLEAVVDSRGDRVNISVPLEEGLIDLEVWKLSIGRIDLYLLDSDNDKNSAEMRELTKKLYHGGQERRIEQEIILGIGGVRLLRQLGMSPEVYHLNEGHCAFLIFELLREEIEKGSSFEDALPIVREKCVFTTHTPVIAGHDRFSPELFKKELSGYAKESGLDIEKLIRFGRIDPSDENESFTMTLLGLDMARTSNGVSKLNGEVARRQWQENYPDVIPEDIPIGHVTNGVHLPTWSAPEAQEFVSKHISDWKSNRADSSKWSALNDVSDESLWAYRRQLRGRLIDYVNEKLGETRLDPDALTIGFARRFATYKRATLLFSDLERARRLFDNHDRPVQILFAGKAHPRDQGGKDLIKRIYDVAKDPSFNGKVLFLENYNMEIGRFLVSGSDVWLNNPRRPMEASGTSGQKVAIHGGLNLSVLDGWWPEGFDGTHGWAIGDDASANIEDASMQDPKDADFLYEILENELIPSFYTRDKGGLPKDWIERMRSAMTKLPSAFSAERMVRDYINQYYFPAR